MCACVCVFFLIPILICVYTLHDIACEAKSWNRSVAYEVNLEITQNISHLYD